MRTSQAQHARPKFVRAGVLQHGLGVAVPTQGHRGHADHVRRMAQLPFFHDVRVGGGRRGDLPAFWHVLEALRV